MKKDREAATPATPGTDPTELRTLEDQLTRVIRRLDEIPADIAATEGKIVEAKIAMASVESRVEEKRLERQQRLAEGQDVQALTREIGTIRAEQELAEDSILGLQAKVKSLQQEELRLQTEDRPNLDREIARRKLVPLVARYNEIAAQLAEVTEAIFQTMLTCRQSFSQFSSYPLNVSSWAAFSHVPCLSLDGRVEDSWNTETFYEQIRQAREAERRNETAGVTAEVAAPAAMA
jgi:hypothetical protein